MRYSLFALVFWEKELLFLKAGKGMDWEVPVGSLSRALFSQRRGITPAEHLESPSASHLPPAPAQPLLRLRSCRCPRRVTSCTGTLQMPLSDPR